jgi:uncharacterized membrane protein
MPLAEPAAALAPTPSPALQQLRTAQVALLLLMVALGLAWELVLAPTGRGSWAIKVLPLLLALPGLLRHRLYTVRWLSLLLWLYVLEGLMRAVSDTSTLSQALAALQTLLALLLFGLGAAYVRLRLRGPRVEGA